MEMANSKRKILLNRDNKQNIIILIVFVAIMAVFSIGSEYFLKPKNIVAILVAAVPLGLIAIGECTCLVSGFFDMSPGMVASLSGVIWAVLITRNGMGVWPAFFIALAFGVGSGCIAGASVAWLKMPAWMATYALYQIWRGVIMIITEGTAIRMTNYADFKIIGQTKVIGDIPLPVILLILAYILMYFVFRYTKLGRALFTIGGNVDAAKNIGIRIDWVQFFCFVLSGFLASLGGLLFASRSASAQPIIGELYAMQAIAATVVGGTRMGGGKANLAMTFIGVLIVVGMQNGMSMINVPTFYQYIATGVILFIAVLFQTDRPQ